MKNANEFLYLALQGDEYCQNEIYTMYLAMLRNITNAVMQQYAPLQRYKEDILQEASIAFFEAMYSYRDDKQACFSTFVSVVVRRKLWNYCRRMGSSNRIPLHLQTTLDEDEENERSISEIYATKDHLSEPEYRMAFHEAYDKLQQCVQTLKVEDKSVYDKWVEGASYEQAVKDLNLANKKTYEGRLRKVRRIIHDAIQ